MAASPIARLPGLAWLRSGIPHRPRTGSRHATLMLLIGLACPLSAPASASITSIHGQFGIEPSSSIRFVIPGVVGGTMHGRFAHYSGRFVLEGVHTNRDTVTFQLRPASVSTGHVLLNHVLRSRNGFDAADFPIIAFQSRRVDLSGRRAAEITGDLTIRGHTHQVMLHAQLVTASARQVTLHVTGQTIRSDYGMTAGRLLYRDTVSFDLLIRGARMSS